jgi:hypothetical protein
LETSFWSWIRTWGLVCGCDSWSKDDLVNFDLRNFELVGTCKIRFRFILVKRDRWIGELVGVT